MINYGNVTTDDSYMNDVTGLVVHLKNFIRGYVLFNAEANEISRNIAYTFCASQETTLENTVVIAVSSTSATQITVDLMNQLNIPMILDVSDETSIQDIVSDNDANLSVSVSVFQPPSKSGNLGEFGVYSNAITIEYSSGSVETEFVLNRLEQVCNGECAGFGWGPEQQFVSDLATRGVYVHPSDWAKNLATLTNTHIQTPLQNIPEVLEFKSNVHTVCFVMTDGDNVQWLLNDFAAMSTKWWGAENRGEVPMGWTISPAIKTISPPTFNYLMRTRSENDELIAGPSGLGYTYPEALKGLENFASVTETYMVDTGLTVLNIIGHSDEQQYMEPFLVKQNIDGILYYTFADGYAGGSGKLEWVDVSGVMKPVVNARWSLWGDATSGPMLGVNGLVSALESMPKDTGIETGYSLIPVHAWTHDYSDVVSVVEQLGSSGFEVLMPSQFLEKLSLNLSN